MTASRVWTYPKGSWSGPPIVRGGDEYGNSTLAFRLPGERALIVVWNIPLRRELEPCEGRVEYGWVGESVGGEWDNPLPVAFRDRRSRIPDDCTLVRREVRWTPWVEVKEDTSDAS